jgi:hypothetical protein
MKDVTLRFRIYGDDARRMRERAGELGFTLSEWARITLLGDMYIIDMNIMAV